MVLVWHITDDAPLKFPAILFTYAASQLVLCDKLIK